MRAFFFFLLTILPLASQGAWVVKSDFQLHLTEKLFDEIIGDFWHSLQGQQNLPIDDFTVSAGPIPIQISGIEAKVNYSFSLPKRVDDRTREWELHSENVSARLKVRSISANTTVVREENGIIIVVPVRAECRDVTLKLPAGLTSISARIRAEVIDNQVKLALPSYEAEWRAGAWEVENMHCTGIDGIGEIVKAEALKALSSFQNFDAEVREGLTESFKEWSKDASRLLLSERELPTSKDYLKVYYEPRSAVEVGSGLLLAGELRFEYPFVAPGQNIEHVHKLAASASARSSQTPQLLLPFGAVRSLMMGEYFAGKLEHSIRSREIPAFSGFMQSRWKQFWAWPELMRYPTNAEFAFQFLPMGPPSFENERAGANNSITGQLTLPLSVRMYAPINGKFHPMVEFRTMATGPTSLRLLKNGKIEMQIRAQPYPIQYAWAQSYVRAHNPTQRVAVDTIGEQVRNSLNTDGFTMEIPSLTVGKSLHMVPERWNLEGANLRLDFVTKK